MMMFATLRRSGGIDALARKLDVQPPLAALGTRALLPLVLGGFRHRYERAGGGAAGAAGLIDMLDALGGGGLAITIMTPMAAEFARGQALLAEIFGSDRLIGAVSAHAAGETGLEPELIGRLLPLLAMLVGGYIAARAEAVGLDHAALGAEIAGLLDLERTPNPLDVMDLAARQGSGK